MAEVVRRPSSSTERTSSGSRSYSQSPQKKKALHRSDSFSSSTSQNESSGHQNKSLPTTSLPSSPSKEEKKRLAKEILASGSDQLRATLKQRGMLHALLADPVKFIKSTHKQGQDYTTLGLTPVNDPNFAANQKRKQEQKQHSLLLHTDSPKVNGASMLDQDSPSPTKTVKPKSRDLYPYKISLRFPGKVRPVATGLSNYGNTCYMNSVMQALIHTPPLAYALLTQDLETLQGDLGGKPGVAFDAVSAMQNFARRSLQGTRSTNAPQEFNRNLKAFAKPLRQGRQEDAHEYLRFLLEALQQNCLSRANKSLKPDDPIRTTTFVQKIFGGKLRSRVTCHNCGYNSDTYDPFMDLSLDVRKGINSLTDAFRAFTSKDSLTGSEKYKCDKCKRKVDATKQFTIHSAPPALTIHLKRFTMLGGKISRQIEFAESINIAPYLSEKIGQARYKLYATVHHYGSGPNSGHYVASVKRPGGKWCRMDDSHVSEMSKAGPVAEQSAYILFYLKENEALDKAIASASAVAPVTAIKRKQKDETDARDFEADSSEESNESFDDEKAYQALLQRRRTEKAVAPPSPFKSRKTSALDDEETSESDRPAASTSASSQSDQMLSSQPKSSASFYGVSPSSSRLPSNPFTLPSADTELEELGTSVDRSEYESLIPSAPASPSKSKKERRKEKKAAQAIELARKQRRGIPTSPYASALTSSLSAFAGKKEGKKKKKDKGEKGMFAGGFAGRMKPRPSSSF